MNVNFRIAHAVAAILAGVSIIGITGGAMAGVGEAGHAHAVEIGQPGEAAKATRTVRIETVDNLFNLEKIEVKKGETVRFVITNKGELLHEFNIGTTNMHAAHQKEMEMMADQGMLTPTGMNEMSGMDHSKMGHSKGDMAPMKHDDPNSVLIGPGQTKELTWTFSKDAALEFACNIPGHYESGMAGKIVIQK